MQCTRCKTLLCYKCCSMDKTLVKTLNTRNDTTWFCPNCSKSALNAVATEIEIEQRCDKYMKQFGQRLSALESQNEALTTRLEATVTKPDLDKAIKELTERIVCIEAAVTGGSPDSKPPKGESLLTNTVREEISERQDIEARRMNLIVTGLPEQVTQDEEPNNDEEDAVSFSKMIRDEFKLKTAPLTTERVGRTDDGKPRMMRVSFTNPSDRKQILAKATQLRSSTDKIHSNVFIRPDLTKKQREISKNLRRELKKAKEREPEKHFIIKNNQLMEKTT